MLAKAPIAVIPSIAPDRYVPHALHAGTRDWPETNCYIDVWIEILHALGEEPASALGFTAAQDFEGDHFTFTKLPLEDLRAQFGFCVQELALYDRLETHIIEQSSRGRMVLIEVDGFYLPDTRGVSYRIEHTKTTIAINRIDPARQELDYFHGAGFHALGPDDYAPLLMLDAPETTLFPYAEFVKFDRRKPSDANDALRIFKTHLANRPLENPVVAFRERLRDQVVAASARPPAFLHKYAFNTARQLGMNFELLGAHLDWLESNGLGGTTVGACLESCKALSSGAKSFQFQLARAVARKRFDGIETTLDPLVATYSRLFEALAAL